MDTGEFTGFEVALRKPGMAWLRFNTPERLNGMTTAIKRDLIEAVTQVQMDSAERVLVFTGSGRTFCAGDDLKAYRGAELGGKPLVPDIPPGHDSGLGTCNAAEFGWEQALDEIAAKTAISDQHPDAQEGVTAFHEKRPPKFNDWLRP